MYLDSLILIFVLILNEIISKFLDSKMKCNSTSLEDILHKTLPNLVKYEKLIDVYPVLIFIVMCILIKTYDKIEEINFSKVIRGFSFMYFTRIIMYSSTILPSPICQKNSQNRSLGGCQDCIFSGHVGASLILSYLIYKIIPTSLTMYTLIGLEIIYSLFVIATRSHYTIDVMIAWLVVFVIIQQVIERKYNE